MQKETYFYPSSLKNIEELLWLNKSDTNFLWIYKENEAQKVVAENMMIEKLIQNPRVLSSSLNEISILKFTGQERFHFIKKNFPVKKVVLFGIPPQDFGIQIQLQEYNIIPHLGYYFLKIDSPEELPNLPSNKKVLLAQSLQQLSSL